MSRPVYNSVLANIRHRVNAMPNGATLPTIRELTTELKASQGSVQAALKQLINEGLIKSYVGRGTFVERGSANAASSSPRTRAITILRGDYPSRRNEELTQLLCDCIVKAGHRAAVLTYTDHRHAEELLQSCPRMDGCIVRALQHQLPVSLLALLRERSDAMVVSGVSMNGVDVDSVFTNLLGCYEQALRHLYDLGHRHIALATGEPTISQANKIEIFETLHRCMRLPREPSPLILSSTHFSESATAGMRETLLHMIRECGGKLPFTALIVVSYASAVGAMEALKSAGIRVPEDISVVVEEVPDITGEYASELTMVGKPMTELAQSIFDRIEWRWQHPDAPCETLLHQGRLFARRSSMAPAPEKSA